MPDVRQPASVGSMRHFLIVATGGAGGDLPPLVAAQTLRGPPPELIFDDAATGVRA